MTNKHLKAFMGIVSAAPILYLIGLTISLTLYLLFPVALFPDTIEAIMLWVGIGMIVLATVLVFWAHAISREGKHRANHHAAPTCADFMRGPYRFMRHPGAFGLMIMFAGFSIVANSLVMAMLWLVFVLLETIWFIPMEESVYLAESPDAYREYKKRVKMWL